MIVNDFCFHVGAYLCTHTQFIGTGVVNLVVLFEEEEEKCYKLIHSEKAAVYQS